MAKAVFVASTGRCATQFLAQQLKLVMPGAVVEHEPIKCNYVPRSVFRRPWKQRLVARNGLIAAKLAEIKATLNLDRDYVDTGWPTFAWIPYLERRFGTAFAFYHIVRNPFHTAASLVTHGFFAGRDDLYSRQGIIQPGDHSIAYRQFAEIREALTPFEHCLFHWLEVNAFILDQHARKAFQGLTRFEDLISNDKKEQNKLLSQIAGRSILAVSREPYDKHNHGLRGGIAMSNQALVEAVVALAVKLGYDRDELHATANADYLVKRYAVARLDA